MNQLREKLIDAILTKLDVDTIHSYDELLDTLLDIMQEEKEKELKEFAEWLEYRQSEYEYQSSVIEYLKLKENGTNN